ncbi:MAG TPA: alkaline phosphatase family protein [Gaiellaceae bacterium]|jgi:phospholipase C
MRKRIILAASALAVVAWIGIAGPSSASNGSAIPHYQHIVEIMMENTSYGTIIGNPDAPHLNALANTYGLATNYFGVTHPSEPNYVANVGGSYFGIQDDNQFYCTPAMSTTDPECAGTTVNHTVSAQSIADQLTAAGMTWKGYFQSLPPKPATYVKTGDAANGPYTYKWPSSANALYASKHNPFVNFTGTQDAVANMVPDTQLATDLANNALPNYSMVVPDQCNDMHGTGGCSPDLIAAGDNYVNNTVKAIMASKQWGEGRNAIVVTWDEDDFSDSGQPGTGCCGSDPGGGHVATIVITNKTKAPTTDSTAYNHYSLLRSMEDAFGLGCLAGSCDVTPMTPLFHS